MAVNVMTWVFEHSRSRGGARLVLLAMADEAAKTGELSAYRRSQSWIAEKCNMTVRGVRKSIDDLVALGELEVLSEGVGFAQANYRILMESGTTFLSEGTSVPLGEEPRSAPSSRSLPLGPVPSCPTSSDVDERFEKFWKIYPRKEGKKAARSAFKSMMKRGDREVASKALPVHILSWRERPADKIPLAASWLNGQRYFDELTVVVPVAAGAVHRDAGKIRYRSDGSRFQVADDGSPIDLPPEDEMPDDWETAHIDPYGDTP